MTQAGEPNEDDIALAGEYALHLLDDDARLAFEARLAQEPELQDITRAWDENLVTLADDIDPVTPPPQVKAAIEERLFGKPARTGFLSYFGLREAMLGLAFIVTLAVFFGPQIFNTPDTPLYTAEIAAEDRALVVQASFDPDTAELALNRSVGGAVPGRVLELWLIADGATAPVSLGVIPSAAQARIPVPEPLVAAMFGGVLAISDEPIGGSPTGAPTGAVLAVGIVNPV